MENDYKEAWLRYIKEEHLIDASIKDISLKNFIQINKNLIAGFFFKKNII